MTSPKTWREEFWKIVDEKGNGANVDLPLALEKLFTKTLADQAQRLREAMQQIDLATINNPESKTVGDKMLDMKYAMLTAFDKALREEV